MYKIISIILFSFMLIGCQETIANDYLGNRPSYVSTFSIGDIHPDGPNYKVNELFNVIFSGKNRQFSTYVQLIPARGEHTFEVLLIRQNGNVLKQLHHGYLYVDSDQHTHGLFSHWIVDIPKDNYFYVVIIDTFKGKRHNVATFKIIIE